jgi:hypothetical protein
MDASFALNEAFPCGARHIPEKAGVPELEKLDLKFVRGWGRKWEFGVQVVIHAMSSRCGPEKQIRFSLLHPRWAKVEMSLWVRELFMGKTRNSLQSRLLIVQTPVSEEHHYVGQPG